MKKSMYICIVAILLCTAYLSLAVQAQNPDKVVDYSKLSMDKKIEIVDKAFNDYLSGKTDKLYVPGAKECKAPTFEGKPPKGFSDMNTQHINISTSEI